MATARPGTMRIGIDGRHLGRRRGIGNHVHGLVRALHRWEADLSLTVLVPSGTAGLDLFPDARLRVVELPPAPYPLWEQVLLPAAARRHRLDVLHCPANTGPVAPLGGARLAVTVHDTMFMGDGLPPSPSLHQRAGARYRRAVAPRAARRASALLTDSQWSRRTVARDLGVPEERIEVVPLAPGACFRRSGPGWTSLPSPLGRRPGRPPFILCLGAVDPRKNTCGAVDAFARYRRRGGDRRLAVTGLEGTARRRVEGRVAEAGVGEAVDLLGFVSESELAALYRCADALLYPSLCEGFGLPVLEAMASGTPVITSSVSALPEVAGGAALLVDPRDVEAIAAALERVAGDEALRRRLSERGRARARRFSWRAAARATARLYRRL